MRHRRGVLGAGSRLAPRGCDVGCLRGHTPRGARRRRCAPYDTWNRPGLGVVLALRTADHPLLRNRRVRCRHRWRRNSVARPRTGSALAVSVVYGKFFGIGPGSHRIAWRTRDPAPCRKRGIPRALQAARHVRAGPIFRVARSLARRGLRYGFLGIAALGVPRQLAGVGFILAVAVLSLATALLTESA